MLWQQLRARQVNGSKFRRNHPVDLYFADFFCLEARFVIADGSQHGEEDQQRTDYARTAYLKDRGYTALPFWNLYLSRPRERYFRSSTGGAASLKLSEVENFADSVAYAVHGRTVEMGKRTFYNEPPVVDRTQLVNQQVGRSESRSNDAWALRRIRKGSTSSMRFVVRGTTMVDGWPALRSTFA
jgi:hypothetical protein